MVLLTGATGTLGSRVVKDLCRKGVSVSVLARQHKEFSKDVDIYIGDLSNKARVAEIVRHASVVVHCASNPRDPQSADVEGTRNLLTAVDRQHLKHFIYVSIAGVDRSTYPYYQVKYEVERMIQGSGVPWSVLRPTQFHDLVLDRLIRPFDRRDGSPVKIPFGMRFQSIDVRDVSARLVRLAESEPEFRELTIAGPEVLTIEEMTRRYLLLSGRKETIQPVDHHSDFHDLFRSGVNLCRTSERGGITWEQFLRTAPHAV